MYRSIKRALRCDRSVSVSKAIVDSVKDELEPVAARALGRAIPGEGVAFFAGAGISVESGLPNYKNFSEHILLNLLPRHDSITKDDISMLARDIRPELVLQTLHEHFGDKIFDFFKRFKGVKPSAYHFALAKSLRQGNLVLTTNFDTLIEDAYEELYNECDFDVLVSETDFDISRERLHGHEGVLIKLHGTIDKSKDGYSQYDTIRHSLDHIGKGGNSSMRSLLTHICVEFDMVFVGYSGCDNFSVLPVLCNVVTERSTLWLWHEWREKMVLETPESFSKFEKKRIEELISEGKSFAEIPRGLETLSTCEILCSRESAFRCRGNISKAMHAAIPELKVKVRNEEEGPIPTWTREIPIDVAMKCASQLFSMSGRLDIAITMLEEAKTELNVDSNPQDQGLILKSLGNLYVNTPLSSSYERGLNFLEASVHTFNQMGDYENLLDTQLDIADTLRQMKHFDGALQILKVLENLFNEYEHEIFVKKAQIRKGLIHGLILGIGRVDPESKEASLQMFEDVAQSAEQNGFVSLHAAVLNASSLIKYQTAGQSVEHLESAAHDINTAYQLNFIIGDSKSCFQLVRTLGIIFMDLSRLKKEPEIIRKAIANFRIAESFLFRQYRSDIVPPLQEIRLRLGKALVAVGHLEEAEGILLRVQKYHAKLGDWYIEAQILELLIETASNSEVLINRCEQIRFIFEDAKGNETKKNLFKIEPHTLKGSRYILRSAANCVRAENNELAMILQKLMVDAFVH